MKEKMTQFKNQLNELWNKSSRKQKVIFFSVSSILLALIIVITINTSTTKYVPLYSNLSVQEVAQIKEELEARNVSYELEDGGTTVLVPEEQSDHILVEFVGVGIKSSGNIYYYLFTEQCIWIIIIQNILL